MPDLLPPVGLFLPFLVASVAINLTPGADMTFVAVSGARGGQRAGLAAAAGIFAGCFGHIALAVVGLSALIAASQQAFTVVKWLGVAYLAYLALRLVREGTRMEEPSIEAARIPLSHTFRQAALVNLLNPKVGIFFLAFLPQFVDPSAAAPWLQILALGLVFNTTGALVNGSVGVFSAAAAQRFGSSRHVARGARWFAATVLGALAVRLAASGSQ